MYKFIEKVIKIITPSPRISAMELYLNQSTDIFDVERRQQHIMRNPNKIWYINT